MQRTRQLGHESSVQLVVGAAVRILLGRLRHALPGLDLVLAGDLLIPGGRQAAVRER
jgi:uncharacterized protein (DUF1786 family)